MMMNSVEELAEKLIVLQTEKKSQDRELKELKDKVEVLTASFNGLALTNQKILSKMDNLTEKFAPISAFIEELKSQPKKEIDKFKWLLISGLVGIGFLALGIYLGLKK